MIDVGLFDGSFSHQKSVSLGGDNANESPKLLQWNRNKVGEVTVFTDMKLRDVAIAPSYKTRIAMLIEPPSLSDTHYKVATKFRDDFDCILTFNTDITKSETDYMYYPLGGSWIATENWGIKQKSKLLSIISSFKTGAEGHRLRHKIIFDYFQNDKEHVYGSGYRQISSKIEALSDYKYSIVVESCQIPGYFSEKLIDCFSQGAIPIYWGAPDIGDYFDRRGMLCFNTKDDLEHILYEVIENADHYDNLRQYVEKNYEFSWNYRCSEDWIVKNYPFLFEQCERET